MSAAGSTRDSAFIAEAATHSSQTISQSHGSSTDSSQEQNHLSKKPRNYKYWSDNEVKKILTWLTLPENDGKLARNKAQACREVAKTLFDGDEYMAISVRSKLMSLEKSFREAEQLRSKLSFSAKDEATINEKIKEVSKFHKECKQLFGRSDAFIPPISTSPPPQHNNSHNGAAYSNLTPLPHIMPFSPNNHRSSNLSRQDCDSLTTFNNNNNNSNDTLLPHLTDDRMRSLPSPSHTSRGQWSFTRAAVDLAPMDDSSNPHIHDYKRRLSQDSSESDRLSVKVAKYYAKRASYSAKQAEYEALKSEYEEQKMEYAVRLAEIERDRDNLAIKKLELELELNRVKDKRT